ncbi:MAG: HAD hydrolase-like protein [Bacteroidota bacterium]|nr:HAD hydrolase-like protein [Bacteroidota bacterium]
MQKIRAVIFDLDGTIGNTLPLCIKAFRQAVEPLIERTVSDAEIIATFGPSEEGTIMALAPDHYERGVAGYLQHYTAYHEMCPAPFEGIKDLLKTLQAKGVRLAMVTGKGVHSTAISLEQFGVQPYFEMVETGVPAGPRKPEGIQAVINHFNGISKGEMIYVGDAPSDIIASKSVGVPVVAAAWAETAEPELLKALEPDALFYTIQEFAAWLMLKV